MPMRWSTISLYTIIGGYITVKFGTGCLYTSYPSRHLGSLSWESRDARLNSPLDDLDQRALFAVLVFILFAVPTMILYCLPRARGHSPSDEEFQRTNV
ncbi:uncharacterized protein P174DRAFT_426081 [Aspergillus novofumigatus IBT 16806]|uniref:Uncharacterized protein n=1 Tax=Aspergillus novofumigatus (strain IBT 16806) TaxID=1392255 RepID=A0A2I1BSJ6_ASPN1|nr:uncharacterized protein P174DRAFT_426081 [Aspergillus novofumigatus IBT 16806]PKX88390.1 hypothetical protein P174DRAFT_426081 [Aspergillus novofumigatus IBT 16806]